MFVEFCDLLRLFIDGNVDDLHHHAMYVLDHFVRGFDSLRFSRYGKSSYQYQNSALDFRLEVEDNLVDDLEHFVSSWFFLWLVGF